MSGALKKPQKPSVTAHPTPNVIALSTKLAIDMALQTFVVQLVAVVSTVEEVSVPYSIDPLSCLKVHPFARLICNLYTGSFARRCYYLEHTRGLLLELGEEGLVDQQICHNFAAFVILIVDFAHFSHGFGVPGMPGTPKPWLKWAKSTISITNAAKLWQIC